ncbi:MAG: hypothetical protein WCI05_04290, partial [Myxococcales bacterium]
MLIAQIEPAHRTHGGDWFYRTASPGKAMAALPGVFVVDLTNIHRARERILREADVVVLNMLADVDLLAVVAERRARGLVTVYELNDDCAAVQPWNPVHAFFANRDNLRVWLRLAHTCNAIQFCTSELVRLYGYLNAKYVVFPNQLATVPRLEAPRTPGTGLVLGWGGSHGHLEDMASLVEPLSSWLRQHPEVSLAIMGSDPIQALFAEIPGVRLVPAGTLDDYNVFVGSLDIGLAPLADTGFNRCRSDVKFLEYASHGAVAVLQRLAPYEATVREPQTALLFSSTGELLASLDALVADPQKRFDLRARAHGYVSAERREGKHAAARTAFYRSLGAGSRPQADRLFRELLRLSDASRDGRHLELRGGRYEALVHDALVVGQLNGQRAEGLALLEEATRLEPTLYQPDLFASVMTEEPGELLLAAAKKNSRSVGVWLQLASFFERGGNAQAAVGNLLRAAELVPAYEAPYRRLGELLERMGDKV